ncbi:MAG TPA: hypothetical protein PK869_06875 [Candidatus Hydrogenedentes bacterium]|nr:hypothetical protein [Candidatus Hydrogenedentota bacterium]
MYKLDSNLLITPPKSDTLWLPVAPKLVFPDPPAYSAFADSSLRRDAEHYERVAMDLGRINLQGP